MWGFDDYVQLDSVNFLCIFSQAKITAICGFKSNRDNTCLVRWPAYNQVFSVSPVQPSLRESVNSGWPGLDAWERTGRLSDRTILGYRLSIPCPYSCFWTSSDQQT